MHYLHVVLMETENKHCFRAIGVALSCILLNNLLLFLILNLNATLYEHSHSTNYFILYFVSMDFGTTSYDVASWSEITPCNKIDKPLVVYRLPGNLLTSITTLCT